MTAFPLVSQPTDNLRPTGETAPQSAETAKKFEAVFLSQFVDKMMKTAGDTAFGSPDQAEMWRSFLSDAISRQLVEQGGIGLTGQVQEMMNAYTRHTPTKEE